MFDKIKIIMFGFHLDSHKRATGNS